METILQKFGYVIAIMAIIFTSCKKDETPPVIPTFTPVAVEVVVGSAVMASIITGMEPFTVKSSDESKATVTVDGKTITVSGRAAGAASITVTGSDNGTANLAVAVSQKPANAPTLSASALEMEEGFTTTATITGGTPPFTVISSNEKVATATVSDRTIIVKGVDGGTALMTVTGSDGGSATFAVNVNDEQIFFGPSKTQLGSGRHEFSIKRNHTIRKGVYTLVGWIYVEEGATLTIDPGTIFKGSDYNWDGEKSATGSSLIIKRGAKIVADGTREEPIVFTSAMPAGQRQATDWGGIILCGKARNNQGEMLIEGGVDAYHGGDDDNDNSGILRFVRLEFGGYPYALDTEINGLTLGSIGRGTTLEYIQVSYAGDDSFEWFGGSVNAKYLVAYHGWDDDFDTDNGFSGKIQFALGVRDPKIGDQSNSNGFESDNNASGSTQTPYTSAIFSNMTIIGPMKQDIDNNGNDNFVNQGGTSYVTGYSWGNKADLPYPIRTGIFQAAMQIRRNSRMSCFNSVLTGYPLGIMLSNDGRGNTQEAAADDLLKVKNVFLAGMGTTGADADKKDPSQWSGSISINYFRQAKLNNREFATIDELMLNNPKSKLLPLPVAGFAADNKNANWGPMTGSPLLGAADFTDTFLNDSFFTKVTYVGAFASDKDEDNWLKGWTNFDPQNMIY